METGFEHLSLKTSISNLASHWLTKTLIPVICRKSKPVNKKHQAKTS